jgi:hypothetical protein
MVEEIVKRIERLIEELLNGESAEIFGKLDFDVVDVDRLALIKGNKIYFSRRVGNLSDRGLKVCNSA